MVDVHTMVCRKIQRVQGGSSGRSRRLDCRTESRQSSATGKRLIRAMPDGILTNAQLPCGSRQVLGARWESSLRRSWTGPARHLRKRILRI